MINVIFQNDFNRRPNDLVMHKNDQGKATHNFKFVGK